MQEVGSKKNFVARWLSENRDLPTSYGLVGSKELAFKQLDFGDSPCSVSNPYTGHYKYIHPGKKMKKAQVHLEVETQQLWKVPSVHQFHRFIQEAEWENSKLLHHFLALLRTASAASKWAKSVGLLQWPQKRQGPIPFTMIRDFPWGFPFTTQVLQVYWFLVAT